VGSEGTCIRRVLRRTGVTGVRLRQPPRGRVGVEGGGGQNARRGVEQTGSKTDRADQGGP